MTDLLFRRHGVDDPYTFAGTITNADPGGDHTRVAHITVPLCVPAWPGVEVLADGDRWRVVNCTERHDLGERELVCIKIAA